MALILFHALRVRLVVTRSSVVLMAMLPYESSVMVMIVLENATSLAMMVLLLPRSSVMVVIVLGNVSSQSFAMRFCRWRSSVIVMIVVGSATSRIGPSSL